MTKQQECQLDEGIKPSIIFSALRDHAKPQPGQCQRTCQAFKKFTLLFSATIQRSPTAVG
jgi:hypothetical protein